MDGIARVLPEAYDPAPIIRAEADCGFPSPEPSAIPDVP